jgi:hypothetical protein
MNLQYTSCDLVDIPIKNDILVMVMWEIKMHIGIRIRTKCGR